MKDIRRLLWCLSNLNLKNFNSTDIENVIVPNILERIEAGELKNDSFSLIEIVLYLWMLNYRTYELMPYGLSNEDISFIKESNSPTRHRLNLLLSCIFYEDRGLFREFNILPDFTTAYDMKYQLEKRPLLQRIMENLTTIGVWQNVNKTEAEVIMMDILMLHVADEEPAHIRTSVDSHTNRPAMRHESRSQDLHWSHFDVSDSRILRCVLGILAENRFTWGSVPAKTLC
ncbi:hypothetical protein JTB14_015916 [Gonioctena quinquepunctata]|nr:hypothetical protein JTB14_015916 [Gonioctena quinquepunctata]